MGKPAVESKTIVVNTIVAIVIFTDWSMGLGISQWLTDLTGAANVELAVLAVVNIGLRLITHTSIRSLL